MLYLAGDNSLTEDMVLALQDSPGGGRRPRATRSWRSSTRAGSASSRRDTTSARSAREAASSTTATRTFHRPGDQHGQRARLWSTSSSGPTDGASRHEERRHLLILSGHGSGTTEDFLLKRRVRDGLADHRRAQEALRRATGRQERHPEPSKKIDILGMDACYMCMGEVAYEIREHADILVGRGGAGARVRVAVPPDPAKTARESPCRRTTASTWSPEELAARLIVDGVRQALLGLRSERGALVGPRRRCGSRRSRRSRRSSRALVTALERSRGDSRRQHDRLLLAHWYAQTYKSDQFVDLKDLCDAAMKKLPGANAGELAICDAEVIDGSDGLRHQSPAAAASPVSTRTASPIYFPWAVVSPDYESLAVRQGTRAGSISSSTARQRSLGVIRRYPLSGHASCPPLRRQEGTTTSTERHCQTREAKLTEPAERLRRDLASRTPERVRRARGSNEHGRPEIEKKPSDKG